ncbi:hypothetical protein C8R46DRAFT_1050092 [Mycena filopes]|nr:hypothetical protein C8R46DRAFT_1050092 [Mycena filopes]
MFLFPAHCARDCGRLRLVVVAGCLIYARASSAGGCFARTALCAHCVYGYRSASSASTRMRAFTVRWVVAGAFRRLSLPALGALCQLGVLETRAFLAFAAFGDICLWSRIIILCFLASTPAFHNRFLHCRTVAGVSSHIRLPYFPFLSAPWLLSVPPHASGPSVLSSQSPTPTQTQTQSPSPPPPLIPTQPPPLYTHQPYTYTTYSSYPQHQQNQQHQPQFAVLTNARLASFGKDETIRGGALYCSPQPSPASTPTSTPSTPTPYSATSTPTEQQTQQQQKPKPRLSGWSAPDGQAQGQGQTAFPRRHPLAPSPTTAAGEKFLYPPGIAVGVRTTTTSVTTTTTTTRKSSASGGAKKDFREREGTRRGGKGTKTKTRSPVKGLFALPPHPHPHTHPAHLTTPATPAEAGSPIRVPLPPLLASIEVHVRGDEDEDGWVDDDEDDDDAEQGWEGEGEEDELRTPVLRSGGGWGEAPPAYRGHEGEEGEEDGEEETPETPRPWTPVPVAGERAYSYSQTRCEAQQGEDEQVGGKRKR